MATWNDYKDHVRASNPEIGKDIDEAEENSRNVNCHGDDESGRLEQAMETFQHAMAGEAEKAGFRSEDEIAAWITEGRRRPQPPHRKAQGIQSLVSYEGKTERELVGDFHNAVDDYLALCEEKQKKERQENYRHAMENMLKAAKDAAYGDGEYSTYEDIFGGNAE